jgi:NAD(P)-dependent dehydrogenase (short-subunit alcohol dehydrogenase family)
MALNIHPVFRQGATALITGAATGIEHMTAQLCYSRGMNLILFDNNETTLTQTIKQFPSTDSIGTTAHLMDVSSMIAWDHLVPKIRDLHPQGIDLLMLNAGAGPKPAQGKSQWQDATYFERTFAINTFGYTNGLASFLESVTSAKHAPRAIVMTGSKQGITSPSSNPAYNASKEAVRTIAEHLSFDLAESAPNFSVHLLIPGERILGSIRRVLRRSRMVRGRLSRLCGSWIRRWLRIFSILSILIMRSVSIWIKGGFFGLLRILFMDDCL